MPPRAEIAIFPRRHTKRSVSAAGADAVGTPHDDQEESRDDDDVVSGDKDGDGVDFISAGDDAVVITKRPSLDDIESCGTAGAALEASVGLVKVGRVTVL